VMLHHYHYKIWPITPAYSLTIFLLSILPHSASHFSFFFNDTATTEIYTLSLPRRSSDLVHLHVFVDFRAVDFDVNLAGVLRIGRSEEHTSELQSLAYLVCRLLLEKKKTKTTSN